MSTLLRITALLILCALPVHAKEWRQSQQENMYLQAVATNKLWKARELASLSNIDPANIAGHPLVAHLMNQWWNIQRPALWPDDIFNYVFKELEQDPNAVPENKEHTVFSTFCQGMLGTTPFDTEIVFRRTIERIHIALKRGAKVTEYPARERIEREFQPLPQCLDVYENLRDNSPLKSEFLQLIDLYLAKGANPNYAYNYGNLTRTVPLTVAIRHFDTALLAVLLKHRANIRLTFDVGLKNGCGHGQRRLSPTDTLIADIALPSDKDVPRAEPFLRAFAAAGGDIKTPIFTCEHETRTLKEMALDRGQTEYARMMMRLESNPPTGFQPSDRNVHEGDVPPYKILASPPATEQTLPKPPANIDALSKLMFGTPEAPTATPPTKGVEGADMLYALYGFSEFKTYTHNYTFLKPDGSRLTVLTDTFTPTLDDSCHLRVAYSRKETTDGKPFFGSRETTYLYDFTKMADINVDIIANPANGIAHMVGGTIDDVRPMVISTTAVGPGAKCELGTQPPTCNAANETITDIHDPDVTPPLLRKAYEVAKVRCKGP